MIDMFFNRSRSEMAWLFAFAVLSVLVALYLNSPCPKFSERVTNWRNSNSSYFTYKAKTVFFKDAVGNGKLNEHDSVGAVLLIHGFPSSSYDWIDIWDQMVDNFDRVVALDLLGYGFSDKPKGYNYTLKEQADIVEQLLKALNIRRCHILAHDYGDSIAQELIARQNEHKNKFQIITACLMNGGMFKETNYPLPMQRLLAYSDMAGYIIASLHNQYIFKKSFADIFGPETVPSDEVMYDYWCLLCYDSGYMVAPLLLKYIAERAVNNERWTNALSQTEIPLHVIYGPADPINPAPGFVVYYKKKIPKGSLDVLGTQIGHYPQLEDSRSTATLYLQFVEGHMLG